MSSKLQGVERVISVIEATPCSKEYGRKKFFLADEQERQDMQQQFPLYVVREATPDEVDSLKGKTWKEREAEEMTRLLRENGYEG